MSQDARRDEEQATLKRARILGLPYIDTSQIQQKQLYKDILTVPELYNLKVIPIVADKSNITFGVTNTTSQQTMSMLRQRFLDQRLNFSLISDAGYRDYMRLYDPPKQVVYQDIELTNAGTDDLISKVSGMLEQVKANDMLAYLVQQAHKLGASDIHLENQRTYVRIRLRIDGVLHPIARLTPEKTRVLLSAIASAANVSTQADDAQQGHISQHLRMEDGSEVDINLRVETVPTIDGMDVVMRLFNMNQDMYKLDKLGLTPEHRKMLDDIIAKPTGLVLAVGPTGSGKTTTLYSILNSLNTEERKIITVEDPVEYQFEGVTQISVTSKTGEETGFADKLRAVLRLDPDIVMIGEIRDMDTAKTALQASLTGHLVLSTFHAASAAAALTRLMDVIGENPLFVSAIRLVMAQRLVRRLDDTTKVAYEPSEAELKQIKAALETMPENTQKPALEGIKLYKPGKSADNPYGYKGQLAIREQFVMSGEILTLLQGGNKNTSVEEIEAAAIKSGMMTMYQQGILKVLAGETTMSELARVIG
ncbi:Flp pilus assembly complex ATPase component TadA [Candidatus Saccharibacteria bacterium]|nr:Flp pilus assembly complex ATPase component TadA [Candidatus Saccharibacteria bacterium]MCA9337456.1 Flp pilus assembly complex ATPase component TadA [Candidatus Saccharibacteria bacterium]